MPRRRWSRVSIRAESCDLRAVHRMSLACATCWSSQGDRWPPSSRRGGDVASPCCLGKGPQNRPAGRLALRKPLRAQVGVGWGLGGVGVGGVGGFEGRGGRGGGRGLFRGRGLSTASRGPFERPLTRPLEGRSGSRWGPPESGPCRLWTPRSESSTPVLLQSACPPATGAPWVSGACSGGRGGGKGLFQSGAAVRAWATPQLAQGPVRWVDKGTAPLVLCNR